MTQTLEAIQVRVGDQVRANETLFLNDEWVTVIERNAFRRGTRIHLRLADGSERTMVSCTNLVVNRIDAILGIDPPSRITDPVDDGSGDPLYGQRMDSADLGQN